MLQGHRLVQSVYALGAAEEPACVELQMWSSQHVVLSRGVGFKGDLAVAQLLRACKPAHLRCCPALLPSPNVKPSCIVCAPHRPHVVPGCPVAALPPRPGSAGSRSGGCLRQPGPAASRVCACRHREWAGGGWPHRTLARPWNRLGHGHPYLNLLFEGLTGCVWHHSSCTCPTTCFVCCSHCFPQVGAMMNEAYQAHDGLPPELFPRHIPTYTGAAALLGTVGSGCV